MHNIVISIKLVIYMAGACLSYQRLRSSLYLLASNLLGKQLNPHETETL